jgi:pilus assembly protein CpaB
VSVRRLLLVVGVLCVMAGMGLAIFWATRLTVPESAATKPAEPSRPAMLTAMHSIPAGTLLRDGDMEWKELPPGQIRPGQLLRGEISETEFLGAITRREFAQGEALMASELVKPNDRRFLAATLKPSYRAVSISVEAQQTASGLVLPGDFVDVILTQNFGEGVANTAHRTVGETVLQNVRVVAVDQTLGPTTKPGGQTVPGSEGKPPKTITLEVSERQAQQLFVAMQLGKLQLAVRPLEGSGLAALADDKPRLPPVWATDVSRALKEMSVGAPKPVFSGSTLEGSIRRAPTVAQ